MALMTARGTLLLLVSIAVGCSQGRRPVLEYCRLKIHPAIAGGSAIDPDAVLLTLDADGALFKDGRSATLEDVAALKTGQGQAKLDPVLIEVSPATTVARCTPLLTALIMKAERRNVAFLATSPQGPRVVTLPVLRERRFGLSFTVGRVDYDEIPNSPEEGKHLWLSLRVDGPGLIRVVEILNSRINEVWIPDPGSPGSPDPRHWTGSHPALGSWSLDQLGSFLAELGNRRLSPFCDLHLLPGDKIGPVLVCLYWLHQVAKGRTIVSLLPAE